jgi:hypothetical protein
MYNREEKQPSLKKTKTSTFTFTVLSDSELSCDYTAGCSGERSDCCTRVCTRYAQPADVKQWGNFLEINAGVMQY